MDFAQVLKWADEKEVWFTVTSLTDDTYVVEGRLGRVHAEYPFSSPEDLGLALWAVVDAIKTGIEYHEVAGY